MYYQSSARPNDPSEPESDRLKTLLDNLNNLRGKLKNFTVIDELGQPIGEINDLILDAGHQLNLVIAQPDAQERQSSVLLNGRRIKKVSVQTQSVFVDITKADVRLLPEYLLPDETEVTPSEPTESLEIHSTNAPPAELELNGAPPAIVTPDFSLDVMEPPPGVSTPHNQDEAQDDLSFLDFEAASTSESLDELSNLELPNEARSLDEFSLLDSSESSTDEVDQSELAELNFANESVAGLPDLDLGSDATDEWAEFDRIMAVSPIEANGTLALGNSQDELGDGEPLPEAFSLADVELDHTASDAIDTANTADLTADLAAEDDFADLEFTQVDSLTALDLSSDESNLLELGVESTDMLASPELSLESSDVLPELDFDLTDSLPTPDLSAESTEALPELSFDQPDSLSALDLSAESTEALPELSFDQPDSSLSFDLPDAQTDDLSGLSFDSPAPLPTFDLESGAGADQEAPLDSEWADFDREMDLPSIELSSLGTPSEPVAEGTTEFDLTGLEMPEDVAAAIDFGAETGESEDLFADADLPESSTSDLVGDFDDALSFVESEETSVNLNEANLVGDSNEIAFIEDEQTSDTDLETISSLADLDFTPEATPSSDESSSDVSESFNLDVAESTFDLDLQSAADSSLDLNFAESESLNSIEPESSLDFALDQSEPFSLVDADSSLDLSFGQPETDASIDFGVDQPESEASLDLGFDQPETEDSLDLSFDQPETGDSLDFGFDQPESETSLDLGFDQPETEDSLDLGFDQPESDDSLRLDVEQSEAAATLNLGSFEPLNTQDSLDLEFDQPEPDSALNLETSGAEFDASLDLELGEPTSEPTFDLGLDQPDAETTFDLGLEQPEAEASVLDLALDQPEPALDLGLEQSESAASFDLDLNQSEPDTSLDIPSPPLSLAGLELSGAPMSLPTLESSVTDELAVEEPILSQSEFGLESIPAETYNLVGDNVAETDLSLPVNITESEVSLPIDSVDAIVPLLEERLKVEYERRKVGEVVVRKRIETRMVQVPVRYEKLVIEQLGEESKTLAEVDLSQGILDNIEVPGVNGKSVVSGEFKSPKTASYVLDAIAKTLRDRCKSIRIEVELDDPKLQKAYQDWLNQCSKM